jgi:hypothetical protein
MLASTTSSTPCRRAATSISRISASRPFMYTLRRSFTSEARPAGPSIAVTSNPSGATMSRQRRAPGPAARHGTAAPETATVPSTATSA